MSKTPTWKDRSSYAQRETDRTPTTWEIVVGVFRVVVTRMHGLNQDLWFMRVYPGFGTTHQLKSKDIDQAKAEALADLKKTLRFSFVELEKVLP